MWTGKMTEEEMLHEHPLELADIKAGVADTPVDPAAMHKRQRVYFPVAAVLALFMLGGVYGFVNAEKTALTTTERQVPTVQVFVPQTPTPAPTQTPTVPATETAPATATSSAAQPTSDSTPSTQVASALTWDSSIGALFQTKCGTCHGAAATAGLNLTTYADAMKGGNSGAAIVPGDAANSLLVQKQQAGGHPGQFTPEELAQIIEWIDAGAPEK
jgi:mono/diheme cytochrome c family protein